MTLLRLDSLELYLGELELLLEEQRRYIELLEKNRIFRNLGESYRAFPFLDSTPILRWNREG